MKFDNHLNMKKRIKALTHDTVPASVKLVKTVRSELRADIRSVQSELKAVESRLESKIFALDSKISKLDSKISTFDSKISTLDSKVSTLDSKIEKTIANTHRIQVLMEEQRSENRIVLDGLKNMMERQDRLESEIKEVRRF